MSVLLDIFIGGELLSSYGNSTFNLSKKCQNILHSGSTILHFAVYEGSSFSTSLPTPLPLWKFNTTHIPCIYLRTLVLSRADFVSNGNICRGSQSQKPAGIYKNTAGSPSTHLPGLRAKQIAWLQTLILFYQHVYRVDVASFNQSFIPLFPFSFDGYSLCGQFPHIHARARTKELQ